MVKKALQGAKWFNNVRTTGQALSFQKEAYAQ